MSSEAIINLIAKHTSKEEGSTPVLITETIVPSHIQLWLCATRDCTVFKCWRLSSLTIALTCSLIMLIIDRNTILVVTSKLVGEERTQRLTFHNLLCITIGRHASHHRITLSKGCCTILLISQLLYLILIMRKVQSCCPCKILIPYRNCIDRELNTTIADFTHIGYDSTIRINERRYWIIPDQILGILVVILDRTIDTTIEEGIIQTNVQHTGFLPLQIRIS